MSFYNMLFGVDGNAPSLLNLLKTQMPNFSPPRFRDCYFDGEFIVVHTRTGGGNRDYYENVESCRENYPEYFDGKNDPSGPWNDDMRQHPWYVKDEDDDFDCTYADFYFRPPKEIAETLNKAEYTPAEKWQILLEALKQDENHDTKES